MILVDPIRKYKWGPTGQGYWCHMVSDDLTEGGLEELHEMARRLGIPYWRFQNHPRHPHYDLPPNLREMALALGAVEVSSKELVRRGTRRPPTGDRSSERQGRPSDP